MPFLIAEALASNIGGTATLIGDPPNIVVASRSGLTFNDFLINLAPIVVVMLVVFVGLCRIGDDDAGNRPVANNRAATIASVFTSTTGYGSAISPASMRGG